VHCHEARHAAAGCSVDGRESGASGPAAVPTSHAPAVTGHRLRPVGEAPPRALPSSCNVGMDDPRRSVRCPVPVGIRGARYSRRVPIVTTQEEQPSEVLPTGSAGEHALGVKHHGAAAGAMGLPQKVARRAELLGRRRRGPEPARHHEWASPRRRCER
jgi:hypothetical protein